MIDGNTYAINKHLDDIDRHIAEEEANWPHCEKCDEKADPFYMDENGWCDNCIEEHNAAMIAQYAPLYEAEKRAGLLKTKEEMDADLRNAGRGHLVKK